MRNISICNSGSVAKCSGVKMEMLWMMDLSEYLCF